MKRAQRFVRVIGYVCAFVAAIVMASAIAVYVISERVIHRKYDVALEPPIEIPTDASSIAEGERLARIRGCNGGCHGDSVGGRAWDEGFFAGHAMAPDLALASRTYSTAEITRIIRHGVRTNGEGVEIMPSPMFYHLSDADLGRIIAFLRSAPVTDKRMYAFNAGPMWRWQMANGEWAPWPEDIATLGPRMAPPAAGDTLRVGEYLARTSCSECHGNTLEGDGRTPNLTVAAAYSPEDFTTLMRTGTALGGRDLHLMSEVARSRFAHFTDAEIAALHAFLRSRAQPPAA
jgi:mono/diheme cytochrome c family protein